MSTSPTRGHSLTVEPCPVDAGCFRWIIRSPEGEQPEQSPYSFATRNGARISGEFWLRSRDAGKGSPDRPET